MRSSIAVVLCLSTAGCTGAFGEYGPGMGHLSRSGSGQVNNGDGTATNVSHSYVAGENGYGAQIGLRAGYMHGSAGSLSSGGGIGLDAHADFTFSRGPVGVGVMAGYTSDQMLTGDKWFYSGIPVGGYAQYLIAKRFFVHAGGSYIAMGSLKHADSGKNGETTGYRGFGGLDIVLSRSSSRDFMFRVEGRYTKSAPTAVAGQGAEIDWTSLAVLGEIVWATF